MATGQQRPARAARRPPLPRYPRIPHLAGSRADADDIVLSARATSVLLARPVAVYEKLDGLNVGLRFRRPGDPRLLARTFGELRPEELGADLLPLATWVLRALPRLWAALGTRYALFGEWLGAQIGVRYTALPDLLICFDLFDRKHGRFVPLAHARRRLARFGFACNPRRFRGRLLSVADLARVCPGSSFGGDRVEGWIVVAGARTCKFVQPGHRELPRRLLGQRRNRVARTARHEREPVPV